LRVFSWLISVFIFQLRDLLPEFIVKPEQGHIPPGEFQLITFRYDAGESQKLTNNVQCVLNHSSIDSLVFFLNGSSHVPRVIAFLVTLINVFELVFHSSQACS
jgi:hypothetical protein